MMMVRLTNSIDDDTRAWQKKIINSFHLNCTFSKSMSQLKILLIIN